MKFNYHTNAIQSKSKKMFTEQVSPIRLQTKKYVPCTVESVLVVSQLQSVVKVPKIMSHFIIIILTSFKQTLQSPFTSFVKETTQIWSVTNSVPGS